MILCSEARASNHCKIVRCVGVGVGEGIVGMNERKRMRKG